MPTVERRRADRQRVQRNGHRGCPPAPSDWRCPGAIEPTASARPIGSASSAPDRARSRREPLDRPARGLAHRCAIRDAVVQPRAAALPELERIGDDAIAAPVRRPRDRVAGRRVARCDVGERAPRAPRGPRSARFAATPTRRGARRAAGSRNTRRIRRRRPARPCPRCAPAARARPRRTAARRAHRARARGPCGSA